jgi:hypothetical protein
MSLKQVEEMLDEELEDADEDKEAEEMVKRMEVTPQTKPVEMEDTGDNVVSKGDTEFVVRADARQTPCRECPESIRIGCKKVLRRGIEIEWWRPTNTCVTHAEDFTNDELEKML